MDSKNINKISGTQGHTVKEEEEMKEKKAQKEEQSIWVREETALKNLCVLSLFCQSHVPSTNEEHKLCPVVINKEFTEGKTSKCHSCYLLYKFGFIV